MNKVVVGIDIGGTITKIGLIDKGGNCISKTSFRTKENSDFNDFIKNIYNSIIKLNNKNFDILSIGIGAPNANSLKGTIETPANLNWKGKLEIVKKLIK